MRQPEASFPLLKALLGWKVIIKTLSLSDAAEVGQKHF